MNLRELTEENEFFLLSPFATKSRNSKGRKKDIEKCDIRTEFIRDRDRIIHSKAFRRLMHKTQVFIAPEGDHFRTRLTHTLEVTQISKTIARALRLNEDLTEAIALGHDLGHTPFGHTGEESLNKILTQGFEHNKQSIRVVENIEKKGEGLNLTYEVLDGIVNHRIRGNPSTLEGKIVQVSDKIAYINHDIDDAIGASLLDPDDLPKESTDILGNTSSQRINFLIRDVIKNSQNKNDIIMNEEVKSAMYTLRSFMFSTVYLSQLQIKEKDKIDNLLHSIFNYYMKNENALQKEYADMIKKGEEKIQVIIDFIASMTDRYALKQFSDLFMPKSFNISR